MSNAIGFDHRGPTLGQSALLQKTRSGWVPLAAADLTAIYREVFGQDAEGTRLDAGLSAVVKALNAGDLALAAVATCLLPSPVVPPEKVDGLVKASPDDPDHPGWPKDTPDGQGGQFRPKDGAEGPNAIDRSKRLQKLAARRSVRSTMIKVLTTKRLTTLALLAGGEAIPGLEAIDTALMIKDIADITAEGLAENKAVEVALDFTKQGPHTLEDLSVGKEVESFSSFDAFKKSDLEKRFGPAGDGYEYHHIVEQASNRGLIPAEKINSTTNIIRIPKLLHEEVNASYAGRFPGGDGGSVRDWLRGTSFDFQREYGLKTLRDLGIVQ